MVNFSIIIPLADNFDKNELINCIDNLKNQSIKPLEIIIVVGPNAKDKFLNSFAKERGVKIFKKSLNKAEARNYGARFAKGDYLVHIDVNDYPSKNALAQASSLINKQKSKAIIMHEDIKPTSYIARIRRLERKFNRYDSSLATPQIVDTSLFKKIKGFDEDTNVLDDWSLHFRLLRAGVRFSTTASPTYIDVETNLFNILRRKYLRGQFIPIFKYKYPEYGNISSKERLSIYLRKTQIFLSDPTASIGLILLKPIEWITFFLGSLNPVKLPDDETYKLEGIAKNFDREQNTNYGRYKHNQEAKSLLSLLPLHTTHHPPYTILELGCGTGRITQVLVDARYKVTPTDVSPAMLTIYKSKLLSESRSSPSRRPKPVLLKPGPLPYKDNSYDYVIAMRVIWHIADKTGRELFLNEALRVAKKGVVMDFAIKDKGLNRLFKKDYYFSEAEIKNLASYLRVKITDSIPLPLGRLLIKLEKDY